ncbi:MAG: rhomboid family intramembrane serine protease [Bacteroidales bacterium]|nr:rhomboid family intramembrane serine protease [Bacteroidales bacterium]MDD3430999.1 rhomboid family intramembrane serine protease [Bacteroidales bacterium]MDD4361176.1 rhomboid family intramembrane serine protease [Bacteroidales bacterium]MDD4429804.1 rhomboid family intramembrane serine protease [Bacteroidales bacterium]
MDIEKKRFRLSFYVPALLVCLLALVQALQSGLQADWYHLGIYPREISSLPGILTHVFVHQNWAHFFNNAVPLFILSWCFYYFYRELFWKGSLLLWLSCGLFTWFIGRTNWHIGASGLIYAYSFFLFFSGLIRGHKPLMAISFVVVFLYGSTLWNMFPWGEFNQDISWEGHLSGAVAGLLWAVLLKRQGPQAPAPSEEEEDEEESLNSEWRTTTEEIAEKNSDKDKTKFIGNNPS